MKIVHGYPPNLAAIKAALNIDERYALFTYGDTVYNPGGRYIPDHLMAHEETHARQQLSFEGGPSQWWKRYLTNSSFRLDQELAAFRAQYEFAKREIEDHDQLARLSHIMASELSSPMYGNLISLRKATKRIRAMPLRGAVQATSNRATKRF
jgi:hypothetical protein